MNRQAGLSQIPYSMGQPIQQAGLSAPAVNPAANLTMQDRTQFITGLVRQGMTADEVRAQLVAAGMIAPSEDVPGQQADIEAAGLGDIIRQGGRQAVGGVIEGVGTFAERYLGVDGAREGTRKFSDENFGLTPEEEAARAVRAEDQGIVGEIGDAAAGSVLFSAGIMAGGVVGTAVGGGLGSFLGPAGTVAGAQGGRMLGAKIGGFLGAMAPAVPAMIGGAMRTAEENGHDPNDPDVQRNAIATGVARGYLEIFGIERLAGVLMRPAVDAARQNLIRATARGAGKYAMVEAAAETAGEILELAVFDPEIREQLTEGEYANLIEYMGEKHGRNLFVGGAAGALVGGGIGAPGSTIQQSRVNAQRAQDVETLAAVAEQGGVSVEQLQAAAQDPTQAPQIAAAAREIGEARRQVQLAQTTLDAAIELGDADVITEARTRFKSAVEAADQIYDKTMVPFGAMPAADIEARAERTAQSAREALVRAEVVPQDIADTLDRTQLGRYAQDMAAAQDRMDAAEAAVETAPPESQAEALLDRDRAAADMRATRDRIAIETGRETKESIAVRDAKAQEKATFDSAAERQYQRKFGEAMERGDYDTVVAEAQKVLDNNKEDPDKGLKTAITKLERQLDNATTVEQIDKLEADIAEKRSRLGRQAPIVAAARRALDNVPSRQTDAAAQGPSPAAARQPVEPEATPVIATPVDGSDAVAAAPTPEPEPTSATAPEGAVSPVGAVAVLPADPTEALQRMDRAHADKRVADPDDVRVAAPAVLNRGQELRKNLGLPADTTPTDLFAAGGGREQLSRERDVAYLTGLPIDATPSQMQAKIADPNTTFAQPSAEADAARVAGKQAAAKAKAAPLDLDAEMAKVKQRLVQRNETADALARDDAPVRMKSGTEGQNALVSPSPDRPGQWRITYLDKDGPSGHTDHTDKRAAVFDAMSQGYVPATQDATPQPTADQVQAQARAEAEAAATQAKVDKKYAKPKIPDYGPDHRRGPGGNYTDMLDVFGRRTATVARAREFVIEQGAKTGNEHYVAIDRETGEVLGAGTNHRTNSVHPSHETLKRLRAGRNVDIIHNHPGGTTLSPADLVFMYSYPGDTRIIAVAPDGSSYTAETTPEGRKAFGTKAEKLINSLTSLSSSGTLVRKLYNNTALGWVKAGLITGNPNSPQYENDLRAAMHGVRRAVHRAMAQEGLMTYKEAGPFTARSSRENDAYDQGVKNARKIIRDTYAVPAKQRSERARARSGNVQRPGTVRTGRRNAAGDKGGSAGTTDAGIAEADGTGPDQPGSGRTGRGGDRGGRYAGAATSQLQGSPNVEGASGPDANLVAVADQYAADNGIDLRRQGEFVTIDPERAKRIADAYEAMPHAPGDPAVQVAYADLIRQTEAQYRALEKAGYQFYFFDPNGADPYEGQGAGFGNPWNAMRDLRANQQMAVYPTADGFGTSDADISGNPLLALTDIQWPMGSVDGPLAPVTANDLFRAVHDAFGHGLEGAGFRARGEENAWQAHVRLFTGPAVGALTSETRGQNSWLNYGPHGEANRTAKVEDTVFADQKTGLMPEWTWTEGRAPDMEGGLAEADMPPVDPIRVQSGQGVGRQHRNWYDFSTEIGDTITADEAAAEVLRRGKDGFEHAIIAREDGTVLGAGTNRAANAVASSDAASEYMRSDIAPIRFTHNHPIASPLSYGDLNIVALSRSDAEVVAVLPDGGIERARLTPEGRALPWDARSDLLYRAENAIHARLNRLQGLPGAIAKAQALNLALDRSGFIDYTPALPEPTNPQVQEAINAAITAITDAYPAVRKSDDAGRSAQPGGSQTDGEGAVGPDGVRSDGPGTESAVGLPETSELSNEAAGILAEEQTEPMLAEAVVRFAAAQTKARETLKPPAWMDVQTEQGSSLKAAIDIARTPGIVKKSASYVETQFINKMAPIRNYEIRKLGQLGIGMDSMFKAAEVAVNDPGRNEALLYYGAAKMGPDGQYRVAEGTIGIHTMLKKLPDGQAVMDWMEYMGARRAVEIRAKGLETPLTDADIEAGLAKENPLFKEVAADWKRYNDANVDFLVETGRISKALATTLKADAAYIPFYRSEDTVGDIFDLMDEAGIKKASLSRRGGAVLARDPGVKKLTGGKDRKVNNLIENMIRNSQAMIGAGMRNKAANLSFDIMSAAGDVKIQPARVKTEDGNYVPAPMPDHAIKMWQKGGEYYVVPQTVDAVTVLTALAGMQPVRLGGIHKAMAAIGSFFRQSITLSPAFIVRNMIRDAVSTGVLFQGKNLTMENNMFKGFMSSLRHSASRQAFSAMSGMGDFRFGGTDIGLGKDDLLIELGVMKPSSLGALGYQFRRAVNAMEALGTASELSNRVSIYEALIAEGVRDDEAAYQALTITNYSRKGANEQLQTLLPLVPFLNARIQGLSRTWEDAVSKRGADRQQALMKLATSGAVLAAASVLLWGWNNQDEERREEYKAEPLHRRLNYHIIYVGDRKILIPKAFEVGTLFGTIPEMIMEGAVAGDTSELGQATVMTLTNTLAFNPIPQAIMPALEVLTDYNFFTGRPIEGQRLTSLMREDRINPQTSALAVAMAKSGIGSFSGLSPVQLDHVLAGYGGVAYTSLATMIDTAASGIGLLPERPEGVFGNIPVVNTALENTFRSMFKQRDADPSNQYVEDFYQTRQAITQIYRSAKAAADSGDVERARRLLIDAPATPAVYRLVNRAGAQLSDLNSAIRQVQTNPDMSAAAKRERLNQLITARNRLSAQVIKVIRDAEEKQGTTFRRAAS